MKKKLPGILQSIVDIPLALKGFPKNLARKPKTADELTLCKRENAAYMWLGVLIFVASMFITANGMNSDNIETMMGLGMLVAMVGLGFIIFLLYRMNVIKNGAAVQISDLTCPQCKSMIGFDENVHYDVLIKSWRVHANKRPMETGKDTELVSNMIVSARGEENTKVVINCKCQNCGKDHSFTQTFCTGYCWKERRDVDRFGADKIRMQFENEVRQVCKDVFDDGKKEKNAYGVTVSQTSVAACVADHFKV